MSITLKELLQNLTVVNSSSNNTILNVVSVVDVSGSTGGGFKSGISVLEKEIECLSQDILANPNFNHELYSFDSSKCLYVKLKKHRDICVLFSDICNKYFERLAQW